MPPEWVDELGRSAGSASAQYVRTHLTRVRSIQKWVAEAARVKGALDEEEHWADYAEHLLKRGVSPEDATEQIVKLTMVLSHAQRSATTCVIATVEDTEQRQVGEEAMSDASPMTPTHIVEDDPPTLPGSFVVSWRGGFRRLRKVGECHLIPGVDYLKYTAFGASCPTSESYDAPCKLCFKTAGAVLGEISSASDSSSS